MVTVQLGGNDICAASCNASAEFTGDASAAGWRGNMRAALVKLRDSLPRTLVLLLAPYDPTKVEIQTINPSLLK